MNYSYLFDGVDTLVELANGKKTRVVNFDNGATTPPVKEIYTHMPNWINQYGPIGRGTGQKGDWSSEMQGYCRKKIKRFLGVEKDENYEVVWTKNTTEGLNMLAHLMSGKEEQVVLTTRMEHHSNDLPWRKVGLVDYVEVDEVGRLDLKSLEEKLHGYGGRVQYVTLTGASNVTGYVNPIYEIAAMCHYYGAKIIVDGAQLVAHEKIHLLGNTREERIDFIVFSGHKMYAPFGSGVVVGRFRELPKQTTYMIGGGTVSNVEDHAYRLGDLPEVLEAGTQNLIGELAIVEAIKCLEDVSMGHVMYHESVLRNMIYDGLEQIKGVHIYGDKYHREDRLAIVPFNIEGVCYMTVARALAEKFGIATRCGKFCAHPYVKRLIENQPCNQLVPYYGQYGMVRVSLGLYNTIEEVQYFLEALEEISTKRQG